MVVAHLISAINYQKGHWNSPNPSSNLVIFGLVTLKKSVPEASLLVLYPKLLKKSETKRFLSFVGF